MGTPSRNKSDMIRLKESVQSSNPSIGIKNTSRTLPVDNRGRNESLGAPENLAQTSLRLKAAAK